MIITIQDREFVLLTQCPLIETTERIAFRTEVHQAIDSTEQRVLLSESARQTFNYSLLAVRDAIASMFSEFKQYLRAEYLIPQMLEQMSVASFSGDFISCDTSQLSVNAGTYLLIKSGAEEHAVLVEEIGRYQIVEDEPVYQDGYRIHESLELNSPILQPLRVCIIDADLSAQMNSLMFKPSVTFVVLDTIDYAAAEAPTQVSGHDFYDWRVLLNGDFIDVSFNQHQVIVGSDISSTFHYTDWLSSKKMFNLRLLMRNKQEYLDIKRWLYRRRGRLNDFILPMFEGGSPVNRLYRLNADAVEFQFRGGSIVECVVPLVELDL